MKTGLLKRATSLHRSRQSGQTTIFVILVLGLFLLAAVGFAIDYSSVFFHRQAAQAAADAACEAGVMDMLVVANGGVAPAAGFTVGTPFDCNSQPTATPCQYAVRNGYNGGTGLVAGSESVDVSVSFPTSVTGVTAPPTSLAGANPFIRVDIADRTRMYFSSMLTSSPFQDVAAHATCGLQLAQAPIPIIVLNPTCQHAFEISGSATLKIVGGPSRSVQVNSSYAGSECATAGSSSGNQCGSGNITSGCSNCAIDLSQGGKNFTGSSFGTFGSTGSPASTSFAEGTTGAWLHSAPISDPFATTPAPNMPSSEVGTFAGGGYGYVNRAYHEDGCPDPSGCREYYPGLYTKPIDVSGYTAIFVPGIYYMNVTNPVKVNCGTPSSCSARKPTGSCDAEFSLGSGGLVRPADCTGAIASTIIKGCNSDGNTHPSGGTMFYLNGGGVAVNAGGSAGNGKDPWPTSVAQCPGGDPPDSQLNLPLTVTGNVLLGQCTSDGKYTTAGATGGIRGLLFFQSHAVTDLHKQFAYNGNGSLLMAGTIYAHSTGYYDFIQFQGTPGNQTYLLGEIVTDQLVLSGNGSIAMNLNKNAIYYILKASLLE